MSSFSQNSNNDTDYADTMASNELSVSTEPDLNLQSLASINVSETSLDPWLAPHEIALVDQKGRLITDNLDLEVFTRFSTAGYEIQKILAQPRTTARRYIIYDTQANGTTPPIALAQTLLSWMSRNKNAAPTGRLPMLATSYDDYSAEEALGLASWATAFGFRPFYIVQDLETYAFKKVSRLINRKELKGETIMLLLDYFPVEHDMVERVFGKLAAAVLHGEGKATDTLARTVSEVIGNDKPDLLFMYGELLRKHWTEKDKVRHNAASFDDFLFRSLKADKREGV